MFLLCTVSVSLILLLSCIHQKLKKEFNFKDFVIISSRAQGYVIISLFPFISLMFLSLKFSPLATFDRGKKDGDDAV